MNQLIKSIDKIISEKEDIFSPSRIKTYQRLRELIILSKLDDKSSNYGNSLFLYMTSNGMANSSAIAYIKALKSAMNYSNIQSLNMSDISRGVRNTSKTEKLFLDYEEIEAIYKHTSEKSSYNKVRDLFVFCCYTGLRHNEAMKLTSDNVHMSKKFSFLKYHSSKNNKYNQVPLNNTCLNIIKKWSGGERLLPVLSDSKANMYLHLLLREMGYTEMIHSTYYSGSKKIEKMIPKCDFITFHTSRHSFASNLLEQGMNIKEVSDIMGVSIMTLEKWYAHSNTEKRNLKAFNILNR